VTEALKSDVYVCKYCDRGFKRESSLAVHVCEQKRRWQEEKETGVQLGLQAYLRFYEMTQGSAKLKNFNDFATSPYYKAFVKWGRHCQSINAINVPKFLEWLLKNNKKLDHWCRESMYDEYLVEYIRREACTDALQRGIEYSIKWSEKTGNPAQDFLRYGNENTVAFAISTGRISPWLVYNCESGQAYLADMNGDQTKIVWPWIDPDFWQKKFKDYPADKAYAEEILKQAGW
jgi:hypothetical protein